jgi:hypothetical protein
LCCPPLLITKKHERTNNGVINIGGQHNNLQ